VLKPDQDGTTMQMKCGMVRLEFGLLDSMNQQKEKCESTSRYYIVEESKCKQKQVQGTTLFGDGDTSNQRQMAKE
jgi:hypothetical protein